MSDISILAADGSYEANTGSNAISILAADGSLMANNGANGISILDSTRAKRANTASFTYSILASDGSLNTHEAGNTYSILNTDGSLAAPIGASELPVGALFADGEQGVWFDVSDLSTLFQDSAGTTPVTTVDQPVGRMLDKSGRGNHAVQATADKRPLLKQDGNGKYYLLFDGVDDFLLSPLVVTQPVDRISGIRQITWTSGRQLFHGNSGGTLYQSGSSPLLRIFAGIAGPSQSLALDTAGVITTRYNAADSRIAVNNGSYVTGSLNTSGVATWAIGARVIGTDPANMAFYGTVMRGGSNVMTEVAIANCRKYMARISGVTL